MDQKRRKEVLDKMIKIGEKVDSALDTNIQQRENMSYYNELNFNESRLAIKKVYIVEIASQKQRKTGDKAEKTATTYQIYGENEKLIATISEKGKVQFSNEFLEKFKGYMQDLNLDDIDFELPEELEENDIVMTNEELEEQKEKLKRSNKDKESNQKEKVETDKAESEENEKGDNKDKNIEEQQQAKIANSKGILSQNVLIVREDSNFYEDHPELEPNLYFYKGADGIIRAEYIDENGEPQPSKYFEPSQTALREPSVYMGRNGNPTERRIPYQVMETKLGVIDKDIRKDGIRIEIDIDTYGYLKISESRQGMNGKWASHDIEIIGRDYNSYELNKQTSIETRTANPDKHTDAYEKVESTELVEDGVQYHEMYLMQHADEIIEEFVKEGYNRKEAIHIFNLMIGEEALTEEVAKERVNDQIQEREEREEKSNRKINDENDDYDENDGGRTPGGDALDRRYNRT